MSGYSEPAREIIQRHYPRAREEGVKWLGERLRSCDREAVEDRITDAVLTAAKQWEKVTTLAQALEVWVAAVVRKELAWAYAKGELARPKQEPPEDEASEETPDLTQVHAPPEKGGLDEILPRGLEPEEARFLKLIYEESYTQAEAAKAVGWAVSKRDMASYASQKLKRLLDRIGPSLKELA